MSNFICRKQLHGFLWYQILKLLSPIKKHWPCTCPQTTMLWNPFPSIPVAIMFSIHIQSTSLLPAFPPISVSSSINQITHPHELSLLSQMTPLQSFSFKIGTIFFLYDWSAPHTALKAPWSHQSQELNTLEYTLYPLQHGTQLHLFLLSVVDKHVRPLKHSNGFSSSSDTKRNSWFPRHILPQAVFKILEVSVRNLRRSGEL